MNLKQLREKINKIDNELVNLLIQRGIISKEIGIFKFENSLPIENLQREREVIKELSKKYDPKFIKKIFTIIFAHSKKNQKDSFKYKVYEVVKKIGRGSVMTYKEVAIAVGRPNACRAVGNILNKNYDPKIPCHRVVRSDGKTGGYNRGTSNKVKILKKEGAYFKRFK